VASIINLVDEIDTTMFVITDKLDDINTDSSLTGGMKIARKPKGKSSKGKKGKEKMDEIEDVYAEDERPMRKANKFETVDKAYLKDEFVRRGIPLLKPRARKRDYLDVLADDGEEIRKKYNALVESHNKRLEENKAPKTPETRQPQPIPPSITTPTRALFADTEPENDEETYIPRIADIRNYQRYRSAGDAANPEEIKNSDDDVAEGDEERTPQTPPQAPPGVNNGEINDGNNGGDGGDGGDSGSENGGSDDSRGSDEDDEDDGNRNSLKKGEFFKSDLNSNVSKLEEQANKLSRLTKGLNKAINYSSLVEVQRLKDSNSQLGYSYDQLLYSLFRINDIEERFNDKMENILDKILKQLNFIDSAINGYSASNYTGGSFWTGFKQGFGDGFYGTLDAAKKVADVAAVVAPFVGAGYEEDVAYLNSSTKRFY